MNLQSGALKREKKQWVLAIIDFTQLVKLRLTLTVVFSALMAYWIALPMERSLTYKLFSIFIGGFLITGAANALNQALEKGYDARMSRTANRPVPSTVPSSTRASNRGFLTLVFKTFQSSSNRTTGKWASVPPAPRS